MTMTRRMRPARRRSRSASGSVSAPSVTAEATVAFDAACRAASCGTTPGASDDLLEQEVRVLAAVDVAGRDLRVRAARRHRRATACRRTRSVARSPGCPRRGRRGPRSGPASPRVSGIGRRLAVEAQVGGGLLDQAVGLAGDDERVLRAAHVERLAAAPQARAAAGRARPRSGRRCPSNPRARRRWCGRLVDRLAVGDPARDQRGDDLGVGGDLRPRPGAARGPSRSA